MEKINVLITIIVILIIFYLVISWGAGNKNKSPQPEKISSYLFGVRVLIVIIGIIAITLWFIFS
tara:strand:- start:531 stop:722 length:192 start_codon:yes stop_codon:yes gene_type:complete